MDAKKHKDMAGRYMERSGDMILREMAVAAEKITPEHFKNVADLCRMFCAIDDFIESHKGDGSSLTRGDEKDADVDYIRDELAGAEKYYKKYAETGDSQYQQLAREELRHAQMLLAHDTHLPEEKKKHYKMLHDQLQTRIG